ncbi:enoyl-CoA hydratase/isomerase family protein [Aquabacterium sp.]|uniref:enoyl-CoA hydratase/isomerase family protein n=1 Tax=Aquabacterium sp. TaxID=1872578 RepID=UPI003D6D121C
MESLILTEVIGGLGVVTLNRPKALNALSLEMVRELDRVLRRWAADGAVHGVLLRGSARPAEAGKPAGPVHFCAGGDIRFMHQAATTGDLALDDFFTEEYALDHLIHTFAKPVIAWLEGVTMGGGMGLAQGARLRVVTPSVRMAMPETRIGLFPDVAGGHFLSRLSGHVGEYLGVVGPQLNAAEALGLGLADVGAQADSLTVLLQDLQERPLRQGDDVCQRVRSHAEQHDTGDWPEAAVLAEAPRIQRHFSLPTVQAIEASLKQDDSEWARQTLHHMAGHSPLMMCVTLEQIRRARTMPLADEFRMERDLVRHCFGLRKGAASETVEGVRALAIDKDQRPRWHPATLGEVTPDMVAAFFQPVWPDHVHPLRDLLAVAGDERAA